MDTEKAELAESDLTEQVIGVFFSVYDKSVTGFLEIVHENLSAIAFRGAGFVVHKQAPLTVRFRKPDRRRIQGRSLGIRKAHIALKAVSQLTAAREVQLVNDLKASGLHIGLLLNFGSRPQFRRKGFGHPKINPPLSDFIRVQSDV